jgi:hypothetical protein
MAGGSSLEEIYEVGKIPNFKENPRRLTVLLLQYPYP